MLLALVFYVVAGVAVGADVDGVATSRGDHGGRIVNVLCRCVYDC